MATPEQSRPRPVKPLGGFGLAGWLLLPFAVALLVVLITGYDLQFQVLRLINETLGTRAMWYWYASVFLPPHYLSLAEPQIGLIWLTYVLVAMHIFPRRLRRWWYALVIAAAVLIPVAAWAPVTTRLFRWGAAFGAPHSGLTAKWMLSFVVIAALSLMTRRLRVGLALGTLALTAAAFDWWLNNQPSLPSFPSWCEWFAWPLARYRAPIWHASFGGVLLAWAIRARWLAHRASTRSWECPACGYDRRGSTGPCPECGTSAALPS